MEYEVPPKSRLDIRVLANRLRTFLNIQEVICVDIVLLLERLHLHDDDFTFAVVPDDEMKGCYAETISEENMIRVNETTYLGAINGNNRDRFTLAHELGHYLLHADEEVVKLSRKTSSGCMSTPCYRKAEWQANTFAGEFLVSEHLVEGMSPLMISLKCGVSMKTAEIQHREYAKRK